MLRAARAAGFRLRLGGGTLRSRLRFARRCSPPPLHFPRSPTVEIELQEGLPFIDVQVVEAAEFEFLAGTVFATDRFTIPKGVIEVLL